MADIKTRDVTRGTIKTLDRAASSMHHLKEETIRNRAADIGRKADSESSGSYAQDTAEHYAGGSAAYAAKAGVEMMLQSREKAGRCLMMQMQSLSPAAINHQKPPMHHRIMRSRYRGHSGSRGSRPSATGRAGRKWQSRKSCEMLRKTG